MDIKGKNVLITGGTSGIGLAVAKAFVESGAAVVITGRREIGEAVAAGIKAKFVKCDVTEEASVEQSYEAGVTALGGKLDVVILNAGIAVDTDGIENTPSAVMRDLVETNLMGAFYGLKHAPKYMNDKGSIILTGSVAGSGFTSFGNAEYAASKAGVAYLGRTAAIEFAERSIRVNTVAPSTIEGTGMMVEDDGSDLAKFYGKFSALGRMGQQNEVVPTYQFLASDASSYVTGQEIRVDGGVTAGVSMSIMELMLKDAGLA